MDEGNALPQERRGAGLIPALRPHEPNDAGRSAPALKATSRNLLSPNDAGRALPRRKGQPSPPRPARRRSRHEGESASKPSPRARCRSGSSRLATWRPEASPRPARLCLPYRAGNGRSRPVPARGNVPPRARPRPKKPGVLQDASSAAPGRKKPPSAPLPRPASYCLPRFFPVYCAAGISLPFTFLARLT